MPKSSRSKKSKARAKKRVSYVRGIIAVRNKQFQKEIIEHQAKLAKEKGYGEEE